MRQGNVDKTETDIALVVGAASWWVPHPVRSTQHTKRRTSFAEAWKDFLQHFSFHCYAKLVEKGRRIQEKIFWLVFHIAAMAILILFLWHARIGNGRLLATTIHDPLYPIEKVAFPAVAFCTINRISNASAWRYAQELNAADPSKRGANYFFEQIHMLRYNYMHTENVDSERAMEFQQFLDMYDTEDMFYDTRRRMEMLTPPCHETFIRCHLAGSEVNCDSIITQASTKYGYCCIFNYNGSFSLPRSPELSLQGSNKGLSVLLNGSSDDYFYKINDLDGYMVFVYTSGNFADDGAGAVLETFVSNGVMTSVSVEPTILETVDESRYISHKTRQCLFADEVPLAFGKRYSFNRCIARCRSRSIQILCTCAMFMSPAEFHMSGTVWCNLRHADCIERYTFKWTNAITKRANISGLEREMEDSLYCPDCYPSCSETRYATRKSVLPLNSHSLRTIGRNIDSNNKDLALVHIYFANSKCTYFVEMLQDSWFQIFSRFGNICSIIAGISLVGICEVGFFLVGLFCKAYQSEVNSERNRKIKPNQESLIILP